MWLAHIFHSKGVVANVTVSFYRKCCSVGCLGRHDFAITLWVYIRVESVTRTVFHSVSIEMELAEVKVLNCSPFNSNWLNRL